MQLEVGQSPSLVKSFQNIIAQEGCVSSLRWLSVLLSLEWALKSSVARVYFRLFCSLAPIPSRSLPKHERRC